MSDQAFYHLPKDRIATTPPAKRGGSRLLVVNRTTQQLTDEQYPDLVQHCRAGDVLVINTTKVIPARLLAVDADGRGHELLILERHAVPYSTRGQVLYRGKLQVGDELYVGEATVMIEEILGGGTATIQASKPLLELAEQAGAVPLPPYMKRAANDSDRERYQTVFAKQPGSVAAPTASLNLTEDTLSKLEGKGVIIAHMTLHVGLGTFAPIRGSLGEHQMHSEYFEIPQATVEAIQAAKKHRTAVIAVGTTVTRALEYAAGDIFNHTPADLQGEATIFIRPGYSYKVVDKLLTNFHAPDSTVLQLAAAFAGVDLLKSAYKFALDNDYQFLSYGDSMLIL